MDNDKKDAKKKREEIIKNQTDAIIEFFIKGGKIKSKKGISLVMLGRKTAIKNAAKKNSGLLKTFMEIVLNEPNSSHLRKKIMGVFNWYPRVSSKKRMKSIS